MTASLTTVALAPETDLTARLAEYIDANRITGALPHGRDRLPSRRVHPPSHLERWLNQGGSSSCGTPARTTRTTPT